MKESILPEKIALEIVKEKHSLIEKILRKNDIDCWLVFVRETSMNPDPVLELVSAGDVVWESAFIFAITSGKCRKIAIVGNFDSPAESKKGIWDEVIPYTEGIKEPLVKTIEQIRPDKIALNYSLDNVAADGLSHGMFLKLEKLLPEYSSKFTSAESIVRALRGIKTTKEIKLITSACELTEKINGEITEFLKTGMTEIEIQELFYKVMDYHNVKEAWQRSSCPSVDAGPDKEFGHIGPSELRTRKNHTLHNDLGIQVKGYCSDLQRMWYFGKRDDIHEELLHAFNTVKTAIRKAAEYIKPGVTGTSVDNVAREYVVNQGYEEYQHALGHQVGRKAHDGGVLLGPLWERYGNTPIGLVEEGNVFTLELYVKTKHHGMVSLEENIVVTKDGCRYLVEPQEEFIVIN